jgi:hypothetical protein
MGRAVLIEHAGRAQSLAAWARESTVSAATLRYRLKMGWPMEEALRTPHWQGVNNRSRRIMLNWRVQTMSAWARELGITVHALDWRLKNWPLEQALTQPGKDGEGRHISQIS